MKLVEVCSVASLVIFSASAAIPSLMALNRYFEICRQLSSVYLGMRPKVILSNSTADICMTALVISMSFSLQSASSDLPISIARSESAATGGQGYFLISLRIYKAINSFSPLMTSGVLLSTTESISVPVTDFKSASSSFFSSPVSSFFSSSGF